jgi:hypothetical protein
LVLAAAAERPLLERLGKGTGASEDPVAAAAEVAILTSGGNGATAALVAATTECVIGAAIVGGGAEGAIIPKPASPAVGPLAAEIAGPAAESVTEESGAEAAAAKAGITALLPRPLGAPPPPPELDPEAALPVALEKPSPPLLLFAELARFRGATTPAAALRSVKGASLK